MKKILTIILILFFFESIAQSTISDILIESIKNEDIELYNKALTTWSTTITNWTSDTLKNNKLLQNISEIVILFYTDNHLKISKSEYDGWFESLLFKPDKQYVLLKGNSVVIRFTPKTFEIDSLKAFKDLKIKYKDPLGKSDIYRDSKWQYYRDSLKTFTKDTLLDIKPNLTYNNRTLLYMTDSLNNCLDEYLRKNITKYNKRSEFLYSGISVVQPTILSITFFEDFKNCIIDYRWGDRGGTMLGIKKNDIWEIKETVITWMQ